MATVIDINTHFKKQRDMNPQETLQLLRSAGSMFWSWGAHAFQTINTDKEGYCKALRFKSEGRHHKGHVYISVSGADLYDVLLTSVTGTVVEEINGLYFDQLAEVIDSKIEYIKEYKH